MTEISHFQIYSQRENHITNNTLLMLKHVYRESPRLLQRVLEEITDDESFEVGPTFVQQQGESASVPDALISQDPFYVYVEAKRGGELDHAQIERHFESIAARNHPSKSATLIGLLRSKTKDQNTERLAQLAKDNNIRFRVTTYSDLLTALESVSTNHISLEEIVSDYRSFIELEGLIPDQGRWLAAMLCVDTWELNVEYGVYFEPGKRNPKWPRARYLGLYHSKCISHVGRVITSAVCRRLDGQLIIDTVELGELNEDQKRRIDGIITASEQFYGDFARDPTRFYIVDEFSKTDLKKESRGGMQGHRYLDLKEQIKEGLPSTSVLSASQLAKFLTGTSFK